MASFNVLRNALPLAAAVTGGAAALATRPLASAAVSHCRRWQSSSSSTPSNPERSNTQAPEGPSAFHNTGKGIFTDAATSTTNPAHQTTASPIASYAPGGQSNVNSAAFISPSAADPGTAATQHYFGSQRSPHQQHANDYYILHVQASFNNTLVTITNKQGDAVAMSSGGKAGFKKANRAGYEPAYQATRQVLTKLETKLGDVAHKFGLHVKLKGFGPGRDAAWKCVLANGWRVNAVEDVTPVAHGGCRPRKARRL